MGNYTTRNNWEPKNDNMLFEHINTIYETHEIGEDNSMLLKMNKYIDNIKSYLNSENVSYNCEDTKVWHTLP